MIKDFSEYYDQVRSQDANYDGASGNIQWKGTDVCMDIQCECGAGGHIDADFFYFYECWKCGSKFAVGDTVKLIKLNEEQIEFVDRDRKPIGFLKSDPDEDSNE